MAGITNSGDEDAISGINVTPFVDIALVLLVVFMVTAKYIAAQSIPVDLPTASTSGGTPSTPLSLSIDRTGQIFLDTTPISDQALQTSLQQSFSRDSEVRAVINADRVVPHGRVVELVDIVRSAGITHFAIQTELPASR